MLRCTRLSTTLDEVIVYPIPALLYLVKNLLQVGFTWAPFFLHNCGFGFLVLKLWTYMPFVSIWQYYIFAYVDAPGYQILKNLNIISTGVLYRIILKKKYVLLTLSFVLRPHKEMCVCVLLVWDTKYVLILTSCQWPLWSTYLLKEMGKG